VGDLMADLPAGLLVSVAGQLGRDAHSELRRPKRWHRPRPRLAGRAGGGNLVLTGAEPGRPLLLHSLRRGAAHRLRWPTGPTTARGPVTGRPSGRLAIVDFGRYSPRHELDIWLLDTVTGGWRHLPGVPAQIVPKATQVEWTPDGRLVIVSGDLLALWRPGESQLALGRVKPAEQPGSHFIVWQQVLGAAPSTPSGTSMRCTTSNAGGPPSATHPSQCGRSGSDLDSRAQAREGRRMRGSPSVDGAA
jgi:hypothetical protein